MVRTAGQERSEGSGEFRTLLEQIRSEVHVVADGHKTLNQQMERFAGELQGEMRQLNQKMDLYLRGLREELSGLIEGVGWTLDKKLDDVELRLKERMEIGFETLGKQFQEHVHLN